MKIMIENYEDVPPVLMYFTDKFNCYISFFEDYKGECEVEFKLMESWGYVPL